MGWFPFDIHPFDCLFLSISLIIFIHSFGGLYPSLWWFTSIPLMVFIHPFGGLYPSLFGGFTSIPLMVGLWNPFDGYICLSILSWVGRRTPFRNCFYYNSTSPFLWMYAHPCIPIFCWWIIDLNGFIQGADNSNLGPGTMWRPGQAFARDQNPPKKMCFPIWK